VNEYLKEGEVFPNFNLPCVSLRDGEVVKGAASDETLRGKPFVLWVFPKVETSGCTLEAREFALSFADFESAGVAVLGVSRDTPGAQIKFLQAYELPYSLASNAGGAWLGQHGLIYEAKMYGKPVTKVARTTFLVGADGVIRHVWENVEPLGHAAQVLEGAKSLD